MENYDLVVDPKWLAWLSTKIENCRDVEEKLALKDLNDMILDVKKRVELSEAAEEREAKEAEETERRRVEMAESEMERGRSMSGADLLRKAAAVDKAGTKADDMMNIEGDAKEADKKTFYDTDLTPEIRLSYEDMCKNVLPPYKPGETPASVVVQYYDRFDAQFIKVLNERSANGDADSQVVLDALAEEQQTRINAATDALKEVLSRGDPMHMEGAIVKLAKEGRIDEPFLLLLEANADQARAAGATGPAELMMKLKQRAAQEKDKQAASKEIKLLRQLLRESNANEREKILTEAFTPKEALIVSVKGGVILLCCLVHLIPIIPTFHKVPGTSANAAKAMQGDAPDQEKPMPDVPPPDFINACKAVLLNFGNLQIDEERGDLSTQIKLIASEAEVVATRIYGQGMTSREQQVRQVLGNFVIKCRCEYFR